MLVCGCVMAVAGRSPAELILGSGGERHPAAIMAFFVLYCANGKDLGKWRNHIFANCAGVVIIVITLFMCWRNMSSFLASLQTLVSNRGWSCFYRVRCVPAGFGGRALFEGCGVGASASAVGRAGEVRAAHAAGRWPFRSRRSMSRKSVPRGKNKPVW
ncbi:MAG: hypothetical protein ACLTMP_14705 [Eggerthella lenta]